MTKFPGNTIQLSDTTDQWSRKVHVNVRNDKVTLVYRWKSRSDSRNHTQRITLNDDQVARLLASVMVASVVVVEKTGKGEELMRALTNHTEVLCNRSSLKAVQ
ncbi:hypothetical protein [Pectobacterium phage Jarilo]|uniref:Uncharacterized protein n=1 Tax=Pectobacterium phage Jarilo TaxID=2163634 RepID=A0A2S1GSY7_9CAUD|nr:hypothetical protein HOT17_gp20 [Pectobacterium phage Jarilo]AWD92501.1 hypothetical protein [Pectobacterium phage Jarilo]